MEATVTSRAGFALAALVVLIVAVRSAMAGALGLADDEAYYRLWSLAPAAAHLDHPPMVGWWIACWWHRWRFCVCRFWRKRRGRRSEHRGRR